MSNFESKKGKHLNTEDRIFIEYALIIQQKNVWNSPDFLTSVMAVIQQLFVKVKNSSIGLKSTS
jgi:hypothetical protein